jgi:hypothetical protein
VTARRCKSTNKAGGPCGAPPLLDGDHCSAHDRMRPDADRFGSPEQTQAAGRLGGRPRKPSAAELARRRLEETVAVELRRQGYDVELVDGRARIIADPPTWRRGLAPLR